MIIYTQIGEIERDINNTKDIVSVFDDTSIKPLYLNHIGNNISFWGQDNPGRVSDKEFLYEKLAYRIEEGRNTEAWGKKFGPMVYIPQIDGSHHIDPQYSEITPEAIAYWEQRCTEVSHPAICLQYMGLLYNFKQDVTGVACDSAFLERYVNKIVEASSNGFELPFYSTAVHLPVAMEIAMNEQQLLPGIKAEYLRQTKTAPDSHVGVWLTYFDLVIDYTKDPVKRKLFSGAEIQDLVSLMEARLAGLMAKDPNAEGEDKLNPFDIKQVAYRLASWYKRENRKADKERVVGCIDTAFHAIISQGQPLQQLMWLELIQKAYYDFGMQEQLLNLYPEIQAAGQSAKASLQPVAYSVSVPNEVINALIDEITDGTADEAFAKFVDKLMPKLKDAKAYVNRQKANPLENFMGVHILSEAGLPLSKIGTPSTDEAGQEYSFCARLIESEEPVMRTVVVELIKKQIFTPSSIVDHIMHSGLINNDRQGIIEKGVDLYFAGDSVLACHLLIPQIEHAICKLALKLDAQALRMQPSGDGYMVQLMDKLFDVQEVHDALGEDAAFYLRTLLTEQRGLNLRNLLCHGLITPYYYDMFKADRIIHALLLLGAL